MFVPGMDTCRDGQELVYNIKLSSVGPSRVTGTDVVYKPSGMDLAMKLHYLKGLYFFSSQASQGVTIKKIKESMFSWSNDYYPTSGRFRRSEAGRPYVKCNDCGIRFVEADCSKTIDEWLGMRDCSLDKLLVYHLPLGPELCFSPSCYIQVTNFKCGGMSLGLSWAHVLGDVHTMSDWINMWGQYHAGMVSNGPLEIIESPTQKGMPMVDSDGREQPVSVKRVDPVGDHWVTANNCKMESFSFYLSASQVARLHSVVMGQTDQSLVLDDQVAVFESLCAIMWKCVANVRESNEPKVVTLCKKDADYAKKGNLGNSQSIFSVKADFAVVDSDLKKLAMLLLDQAVDEKDQIEEIMGREGGQLDYIVYGANLTFVDIEKANLYGLEWNGHAPEFVNYTIQGVGDEGAVMVAPWPKSCDKSGNIGRVVTVASPENEVAKLKSELKKIGLLVESDLE